MESSRPANPVRDPAYKSGKAARKMKSGRRQDVLRNYHVNKCYALQAGFIKHTEI